MLQCFIYLAKYSVDQETLSVNYLLLHFLALNQQISFFFKVKVKDKDFITAFPNRNLEFCHKEGGSKSHQNSGKIAEMNLIL